MATPAPWERYRGMTQQAPSPYSAPADPRLPYQIQRDRNQAAASEWDPRRADAEARKAEAEAQRAVAEASGRPTPMTQQQRNLLVAQRNALNLLETRIGELESRFQRDFTAPFPGNLREYLPGFMRGENAAFDDAGQTLMGDLKAAMGMTGGEANSPAEVELRFGPWIPNATDTDDRIQAKLQRLRELLDNERRGVASQLGDEQQAAPSEQMDRTMQTITGAGIGPGEMQLSRGDAAIDPAREALSRQIHSRMDAMLKGGVPDAEIRAFAAGQGMDPRSIDQALQFRRSPEWRQWRQERPNEAYPFRDESLNVPMDPMAGLVAGAASSPAGTFVTHAGNAATGGTMPLWGQALGGDRDRIRMGLNATREENPGSALFGDIAGAVGAYGGAGAAASALGRGLATRAPQLSQFLQAPQAYTGLSGRALTGDAIYGALQGAGENDDPLSGIVENVAGGVIGRAAPRMFASTVSPTGGAMRPFMEAGGSPTLGQRFRGTGWAGDTLNFMEEAAQSLPLGGRMIRSAREGARQEWQQQRWNETLGELEPVRALPGAGSVGTSLPEGTRAGVGAHRYAQQQFDDAYAAVRGRLNFVEDADWNRDLGQLALSTRNLRTDDLKRWNRIYSESVQRRINRGQRGTLSGDDFKAATSEIGAAMRQLSGNPANRELVDALGALDDALHQGARRHSPPEVVAALDAVDRGYAKAVTLENASRRRLGGVDADPGDFSASDILHLGRNEGVRGRRFLRGDTPFYDEAQIGRRLEDALPSSGTSERSAAMGLIQNAAPYAAGAGAAGGAFLAGVDPVTMTAAGAAAAALPSMMRGASAAMRPRGETADAVADFLRGQLEVSPNSPLLREYLSKLPPLPRTLGMFGAPTYSYQSRPDY